MAYIRVSPEKLRNVASILESQGDEIDNLLNGMTSTVGDLEADWTGLAQVDYAQVFSDQLPAMRARIAEILDGLTKKLYNIADEFERVDQSVVGTGIVGATLPLVGAVPLRAGAPRVGPVPMRTHGPASPDGSVPWIPLPPRFWADQTKKYYVEYGQMQWGDRFQEEASLEEEIARLEQELQGLEPIPHSDGLARMIHGFGRSEQIKRELMDTRKRWTALQQRIREGVPADGPTEDGWKRGGCVHYVAERRDISGIHGDAHLMNDNASAAGYQTGSRPVKGSIMVIEPDTVYGVVDQNGRPTGEHSTGLGHVAYVEEVSEGSFEEQSGYWVTITDSGMKNPDDVNTKRVFVPADGRDNVSFIYDKP